MLHMHRKWNKAHIAAIVMSFLFYPLLALMIYQWPDYWYVSLIVLEASIVMLLLVGYRHGGIQTRRFSPAEAIALFVFFNYPIAVGVLNLIFLPLLLLFISQLVQERLNSDKKLNPFVQAATVVFCLLFIAVEYATQRHFAGPFAFGGASLHAHDWVFVPRIGMIVVIVLLLAGWAHSAFTRRWRLYRSPYLYFLMAYMFSMSTHPCLYYLFKVVFIAFFIGHISYLIIKRQKEKKAAAA